MRARFGDVWRGVRRRFGPVVVRTVGHLPRRRPRPGSPLARDGGRPIRDVRLHPWPTVTDGASTRWRRSVQKRFRDIYEGGIEGLPQPLAARAAEAWARRCGARFGVMLSHGTDALRLGLSAALEHDGLEYGGEVIVPNLSFIASATAPLDRRFGVALVDVDPRTHLLDPEQVEAAIVAGRTRAIMAVHLYGQPADMGRLSAVARRHGLKLIEDAAQAHGAAWSGRGVGAIGDVGAFSFQSSKCLATGEGGMLVTNDPDLFDRAWSLQNVGRARVDPERWAHLTLGWNCRPTEYQAALLLDRLEEFDRQQDIRARNWRALRQRLAESRALEPLATAPDVTAHGMYMFAMRYHPDACGGLDIATFLEYVRAEGIPLARGFVSTIAGQPAIARLRERHPEFIRVLETPVADQAVRETVHLSHELFLGTEADMDDVAAAILRVEQHFSRG